MSRDSKVQTKLLSAPLELFQARYSAVVKIIRELGVGTQYFDEVAQSLKISKAFKVQDGRPYFQSKETQDPHVIQQIADTLLKMQYKFLDAVVSDDVETKNALATKRFLDIINHEDKAKLVNMSDEMTLLYYAAQEGAYDVVAALVQNGADVNKQDGSGDTALHAVVNNPDADEAEKIAIASLLLTAGAKNIANNDRKTPLQNVGQQERSLFRLIAKFQKYESEVPLVHDRVQELRKERAEEGLRSTETDDPSKKLSTQPIHRALPVKSVAQERFDAVLRIKEYLAARKDSSEPAEGVTDNYFIRNNEIFLKSASEMPLDKKAAAQILDELFLEQQNLFQREFSRDLQDGSRLESSKIFELIHLPEDRKKIINYSSQKKVTLLHKAALNSHIGAVEFLLQNGADVAAIDSKGLSAFHYAGLATTSLSQPAQPVKKIAENVVVQVDHRPEINSKVAIYQALMRYNGGLDYDGEDSYGNEALSYFDSVSEESILAIKDKSAAHSQRSSAIASPAPLVQSSKPTSTVSSPSPLRKALANFIDDCRSV